MSFNNSFEIIKSTKAGLLSEGSWLVVRGSTSYLRVLGQEPSWTLVTATANEDNGLIRVCRERRRLIETAIRLCSAMGLGPHEAKDRFGRDYVNICRIVRVANDDVQGELEQVVHKFFDLFDERDARAAGPGQEMVELYEVMSSGDDGSDVYLSDGLWLSSDGSLHDRAR